MTRLRVPAEEHEVAEEVDLLVAGGGSAGCAAAITGARLGLRTALVEEMPFLGGMSTGGAVGTFCGFYTGAKDGSVVPLVGGLPLEIAEALKARGDAYGPIPFKTTAVMPYVPLGMKLLLEERVRREPNLRVRLHAKLTHTVARDGRIEGVLVHTRSARPSSHTSSRRSRWRSSIGASARTASSFGTPSVMPILSGRLRGCAWPASTLRSSRPRSKMELA